MKIETRTLISIFVSIVLCLPAAAGNRDLLQALSFEDVEKARINLNPGGAKLGFEIEIDGDDPGLQALLAVISNAEPSQDHKCANRGAVRLWMKDGTVVAIGLLPGHDQDRYQLRFYKGSEIEGTYSVRRNALVAALVGLGVPRDDPALAERAD